ncbi:hypothetical protein BSKO_03313 [Bryopsis sp. KO-2023]|nr:hypothetical protein BSKO_03313 [Bryopsis sp. KO-2023]
MRTGNNVRGLANSPLQPFRSAVPSPSSLDTNARPNRENRSVSVRSRFGGAVFSVEVDDEEDLLQFPDRPGWYEAKWAAVDQPEWNPATFLRSSQITPTHRVVALEVEISREKVPIMNSYKRVGQKASVRINNGIEMEVPVCCPPFSEELNEKSLLKLKGDIYAGETKTEVDELSVKAELLLMVTEKEFPDLYNLEEDTPVELGPFKGGGLKLRGPIFGVYRFPTVVIFCEGEGIAAARSLINATPDIVGLTVELRGDVKMYYKAPNEASIAFATEFDDWRKLGCDVITTTGSFQDAFDDDETLIYEPSETAAIILTGGDEESEKAALEVCKEAEIGEIVRESDPQDDTVYLDTGLAQV